MDEMSSKISLFNAQAKDHLQNQASNPFSNENVKNMERKQFSEDEYGRPVKGSRSEGRGFKATAQLSKEILELCEIINDYGESCTVGKAKTSNMQKVISFGELFSMYTTISNKLVGLLLRARKHKIIDFEGECLFQRRDDNVPIIMLKPINEIREEYHGRIDSALTAITDNQNDRKVELADDVQK